MIPDDKPRPLLDFYRGDGVRQGENTPVRALALNDALIAAQTRPEGYRIGATSAGASVVTAVNVALALRTPLLVSGEPGSGKTQLGYAIAHELGRPTPLKFVTKSTSQARDLLYEYDAVRHFRAAQAGGMVDVRHYINYAPLGLAILLALPREVRRRFLPDAPPDASGDAELSPEQASLRRLLKDSPPRQAVVIIDEIDKAPRDFPNDLLDEIGSLGFRIPELGGLQTPVIEPELRPVILITTNGERSLPDAFLRRCAYVHMPYPRGADLDAILSSRLSGLFDDESVFRRDVRLLFEKVRDEELLEKPPGVAELIQFLQAAGALGADPNKPLIAQRLVAMDAVPLLAKTQHDQGMLMNAIASLPPAGR